MRIRFKISINDCRVSYQYRYHGVLSCRIKQHFSLGDLSTIQIFVNVAQQANVSN